MANAEPAAIVSELSALSVAGRAPVTGAWLEGDRPGERLFSQLGDITLESGKVLPSVRVGYEHWGTLSPAKDNAILVLHALTGDSHVIGDSTPEHPTAGWWPTMVGPGKVLDTDRFYIVAPNVLGGCQGTTGPSSLAWDREPWGSRFPFITIRDQVQAQIQFAKELGIDQFHTIIGGSLGGMHVLEWAIMAPDAMKRIAVLAAPAETTADQIAAASVQLDVIRSDPNFFGGDYYDQPHGSGPSRGLALARRLAMISYRTADELNERFRREWQSDRDPLFAGGRFAVESYLDFHGNRFTRRFDANSYISLTNAMSSHNIGRNRGSVEDALKSVKAASLVLGISTDRYFPLDGQREVARSLPRSVHGFEPIVLESKFGHDAFLIEHEAVGRALSQLLSS